MEQMLRNSKVTRWTQEQLLQAILEALPRSKGTNPNLIQETVETSITRGGGITGKQMIDMMIDLVKPGATPLNEHETFQRVFGTQLSVFNTAETSVRTPIIFLQGLFNKLVLDKCHMVVRETETMIFAVIGSERRALEFDTFYPSEDTWLIACGDERTMEYGTHGKSSVHGCAVAPAGWLRLGLKVGEAARAKGIHGDEWTKWHKAYHGTGGQNIQSIVDNGLIHKDSVHGRAGAKGQKVIYCSPSLEYSAHYVYTEEAKVERSKETPVCSLWDSLLDWFAPAPAAVPMQPADNKKGDWSSLLNAVTYGDAYAQFVFEVRVRPSSYRVQGNTLSSSLWPDRKLPFDPNVLSENLEWIVENPSNILCTGVMIRQLSCKPKELNQKRQEEMKQLVGWDAAKRSCERPRNYGNVPDGRAVVWAYNDSGRNTLDCTDAVPWRRYPPHLSKIIEDAYQSYQQYAFLGQPEGAPGPYVVDFGSEFSPSSKHRPVQQRADSDKKQGFRRRALRRMVAES